MLLPAPLVLVVSSVREGTLVPEVKDVPCEMAARRDAAWWVFVSPGPCGAWHVASAQGVTLAQVKAAPSLSLVLGQR